MDDMDDMDNETPSSPQPKHHRGNGHLARLAGQHRHQNQGLLTKDGRLLPPQQSVKSWQNGLSWCFLGNSWCGFIRCGEQHVSDVHSPCLFQALQFVSEGSLSIMLPWSENVLKLTGPNLFMLLMSSTSPFNVVIT